MPTVRSPAGRDRWRFGFHPPARQGRDEAGAQGAEAREAEEGAAGERVFHSSDL